MQFIGDTFPTIDYSPKNLMSIDYSQITNNRFNISIRDADRLVSNASHLIDDDKYKPFYYKKLYKIGPDKFKEIILLAEKGKQPSRLFAKLMKDV